MTPGFVTKRSVVSSQDSPSPDDILEKREMHTAAEQLRTIRMNQPPRPQSGSDSHAGDADLKPEIEPVSIRSEDLLQGSSEVHILHGKDVYRLRLTHNGRLILSK